MKVKFERWDCVLKFPKYRNGRTAIELVNDVAPYLETILIASVNLPDEEIGKDEICIKNHSENEWILDILVKAKVVSEPIRYADSGFVRIPICKLLIKQ